MLRAKLWGLLALAAALTALSPAVASAGAKARAGKAHARAVQRHVSARGGLDCNGFSPIQKPIHHFWCTEIAANDPNGFEDNGHYVGHDEPDVGFFSNVPGSSTNMTYEMTLPIDPAAPPQPQFGGVTHMFQLTPAIWFGLTLCDNESYPEGTKVCTPDSDSNIQVPPRPDHAGAAFMELQFYPPGFEPIISCSQRHYCAALTIDSLQAEYGALHGPGSPPDAKANPFCTEPVNFAYLTHNGVPHGPPGPDQQNGETFTPTANTLTMNPGDHLRVNIHDTPEGVFTGVTDLTNGQTGFMVASVKNRFRHIVWDPVNFTCNGAPYAFHPMYNTASPPLPNGQPTAWTTWAAHTDNVAYDIETGHFEPRDRSSDVENGVFGDEDLPCFSGPLLPGCLGSDSDFDGYPYHADWPNGSPLYPTPNYFSSPRTAGHGTYPIVRFETDLPRIEEANNGGGLNCEHHTGKGCTNPPRGAEFYPWPHLARTPTGACAWSVSNDLPNQISNFGGEQAAWGPLELTDYGFDKRFHNFARSMPNPCP
jgi:hypothetical protein